MDNLIRICGNCGKELKTGQKKYCSNSCAAKIGNIGKCRVPKRERVCETCGKKYNGRGKRYCSSGCVDKTIKGKSRIKNSPNLEENKSMNMSMSFIERWKIGDASATSGTGHVSIYIHRFFRNKYNNKCQRCGWGEINVHTGRVPLALHHVDGDCTNNAEKNLELLCPNCHALTDNYGSRNKGKGRDSRREWRLKNKDMDDKI
jgi:hypothetical protein